MSNRRILRVACVLASAAVAGCSQVQVKLDPQEQLLLPEATAKAFLAGLNEKRAPQVSYHLMDGCRFGDKGVNRKSSQEADVGYAALDLWVQKQTYVDPVSVTMLIVGTENWKCQVSVDSADAKGGELLKNAVTALTSLGGRLQPGTTFSFD